MEASRCPMVMAPESLIFFSVPSCAASGAESASAAAASRAYAVFMSASPWMWEKLYLVERGRGIAQPLRYRPIVPESRLMTQPVRVEHDLLGERAVPADAYYGIHTLRALENFPITGTSISIYPDLVVAYACVKQAAAIANAELGLLDDKRSVAVRLACEEVREGKLLEHFVVDVIQGGAGTSTNMNVNEVIANRALEILGHQKGEYQHLHPLDHVNLSQSTNDTYPTAVKLALQFGIRRLGL